MRRRIAGPAAWLRSASGAMESVWSGWNSGDGETKKRGQGDRV